MTATTELWLTQVGREIDDLWSVKYKAPLPNSYTNPSVSNSIKIIPIQNPYVLTWYNVTANG